MREIKFRAWDKKRDEIIFFDLNLCNDESRIWYIEQIQGNEIMQYTGLLDKNGVEIYESDIVRIDNCYYDINIIVWQKEFASFEFEHRENDTKLITDYSTFSEFSISGIEVIGNIYESPELLENK